MSFLDSETENDRAQVMYAPAFLAKVRKQKAQEERERKRRQIAAMKQQTEAMVAAIQAERKRIEAENKRLRQARAKSVIEEEKRKAETVAVKAEQDVIPVPKITVRQIVAEVSLQAGISVNAILSKRRFHEIAKARQFIYWRCRNETTLSYPEIGRIMGRDHSTVMHGIQVFQDALDKGDEWAVKLAEGCK